MTLADLLTADLGIGRGEKGPPVHSMSTLGREMDVSPLPVRLRWRYPTA